MGWLGSLFSGIGSGIGSFLGGVGQFAIAAAPSLAKSIPSLAQSYLGYKAAKKVRRSQSLSDSLALSRQLNAQAPPEIVYAPAQRDPNHIVVIPTEKAPTDQTTLIALAVLGAVVLARKK